MASSDMIRASQAKAMLNPAPIAGPFNAAIVGKVHRATLKTTALYRFKFVLVGLHFIEGHPSTEDASGPRANN
jgi:hypothetical protein